MVPLEGEEMVRFILQILLTWYSEMNTMFTKSLCFGLLRSKKEKLLESKAKTIRSNEQFDKVTAQLHIVST